MCSNLIKEIWRMSTCNHRLDLQTLGSQPIMPKNLPDRCGKAMVVPKLNNSSSGYHTWELPSSLDLTGLLVCCFLG